MPIMNSKNILLVLVGLILLCCCCLVSCIGFYAYALNTPEGRESYCDSLREQGFDLKRDPLNICR
jgi:hypothetical protein